MKRILRRVDWACNPLSIRSCGVVPAEPKPSVWKQRVVRCPTKEEREREGCYLELPLRGVFAQNLFFLGSQNSHRLSILSTFGGFSLSLSICPAPPRPAPPCPVSRLLRRRSGAKLKTPPSQTWRTTYACESILKTLCSLHLALDLEFEETKEKRKNNSKKLEETLDRNY